MSIYVTLAGTEPAKESLTLKDTSRRSWLKGLGTMLGLGLLAGPAELLAATPAAPYALAPAEADGQAIGTVALFAAGTKLPQGWMLCNGAVLLIAEHTALFAVLGNTYGGNGRNTFALPDLRESMVPGTAPVEAEKAPHALPAEPQISFTHAVKVRTAGPVAVLCELRLRHYHLLSQEIA